MSGASQAPPGYSTCQGQWLGELGLDQAEVKKDHADGSGLWSQGPGSGQV